MAFASAPGRAPMAAAGAVTGAAGRVLIGGVRGVPIEVRYISTRVARRHLPINRLD
jgi:hypothetical protein